MPFFGQPYGSGLGYLRPRIIITAAKGGIFMEDVTGSAIEVRDPTTTTQKLAVDANGKIGISSLSEVSLASQVNPFSTDVNITLDSEVDGKVKVSDGGGSLTVDGAFWQATQPVSATDFDIRNLTAATDVVKVGDGTETANVTASNELNVLDSNSGDIKTAVELIDDVVATGGAADLAKLLQVGGTDGTNAQILSTTAAGHLNVGDGGNSLTVDGTFWQVTQPVSATDLDIRNLAPATDSVKVNDGTTDLAVALEDSAAKTAGIQVMGRYDSTIPTAVGDGDSTLLLTDSYGALQTTGHVANAFRAAQNQSSAQTNTELQATPGAGLSLYITDIIISNGATEGNVKLVESTGSTPLDILEVMYFAINGGCVINFQTPLKLTANKNLGYTSVDCTTHSVTVSGYVAP